jgi:hypothetical protein
MNGKFKKMWPAFAASFVACTAFVNADYAPSTSSTKTQQTPMQDRTLVHNGKGPDMMITPNAYLTNRVFFTGEALFWSAREGGLEFAVEDCDYTDTTSTFGNGNMLNPSPKWNVGFRLGLGYTFKHDGWDLLLKWTNFNSKGHSNNEDDCCSTLNCPAVTMWSNLPSDGNNLVAASASGHWKAKLNVVDLELGRAFMTSTWLELRPFVSVRGAWIKEKYSIDYDDLTHTRVALGTIDADDVSMKNKSWGVGPRAGLNSRWGFGCGFSLYGNAAISLLYGKFSVNHSETTTTVAAPTDITTQVLKVHDGYHVGRAVTDLALGFMWEHTFKSDWALAINLGWEQQLYFNQNQFWRIPRGSINNVQTFSHERGDLSFQGITLGGRIDF